MKGFIYKVLAVDDDVCVLKLEILGYEYSPLDGKLYPLAQAGYKTPQLCVGVEYGETSEQAKANYTAYLVQKIDESERELLKKRRVLSKLVKIR